ncbi:hypothetical protein H1R20_g15827, partial [Candolleomyces eurysporus]
MPPSSSISNIPPSSILSRKENFPPTGTKRKASSDNSDIFSRGSRKQSKTDPLVGFGRHFGRTIRCFCRIQPLIKNGLTRTMQLELERITESDLSPGVQRELSSGQLVPSGDLWPLFLYQGHQYNPEDPWAGLFRGRLLVSAYKHVFTSPSSVDSHKSRATRSCNAQIHGMKSVTIPSIAYISTQVQFALSSTPTFSRSDTVTDSEYFYNLVIEILEDPEERQEVDDLLKWWNIM